jgi:hypothetical protein
MLFILTMHLQHSGDLLCSDGVENGNENWHWCGGGSHVQMKCEESLMPMVSAPPFTVSRVNGKYGDAYNI